MLRQHTRDGDPRWPPLDLNLQTARILEATKPDIATVERKGKNIFLMDVVVRSHRNIKVNEIGNFKSYTDLGVARMSGVQATIIPVLSGIFRSILSYLKSHSNIFGMNPSIPSLQMSIENNHKRFAIENEKSFG